jgi:hypothetical protein
MRAVLGSEWSRRLRVALPLAFAVMAVDPPEAPAAPGCTSSGATTTVCEFGGGSIVAWTVPPGVTKATFDLRGAAGSSFASDLVTAEGGPGGRTTATLTVTPGQSYEIVVGNASGVGGGGAPNGGGATDLRAGACAVSASCPLTARVLVAGGGGGGGAGLLPPPGVPPGLAYPGSGGAGGGLVGGDGRPGVAVLPSYTGGGTGRGGRQTGSAGSFGQGAPARCDNSFVEGVCGGAGGGGYYGGDAGNIAYGIEFLPTDGGGGGGGSGFISADPAFGITNASTTSGGGDGRATVTYTTPTPHGTSTSVSCAPNTVAVGSAATCTATVADVATAQPTRPTGVVSLRTDGDGSFSISVCTLSGNGASASCSFSYVPAAVGSGSHRLTAAYLGDALHASSSGATTVTVRPQAPVSKDQCKGSGWRDYPQFKNQGACVSFVNHSRK